MLENVKNGKQFGVKHEQFETISLAWNQAKSNAERDKSFCI